MTLLPIFCVGNKNERVLFEYRTISVLIKYGRKLTFWYSKGKRGRLSSVTGSVSAGHAVI